MLLEICKRTLEYSYICISEYDQSIETFKFNLEGKNDLWIKTKHVFRL